MNRFYIALCNTSRTVTYYSHPQLEHRNNFNPKRPGLFGLPNTRGGGPESAHFGKRSLTPPNFILEQQTESHMKAEVFSWNLIPYWGCWGWNCGLRRSPKWPGSRRKKIRSKILKSAIFELHKRYTPQKKAENNRHSDLK